MPQLAPIDLSAAPFNLDDEALAWVAATRDGLSPRDKLAQLFVLLARGAPDEVAEEVRSFKPGGITRVYSDDLVAEINLMRDLGTLSAVPLLVSADLEGSRMSLPFGTPVPNPLGLAAVDDVDVVEVRDRRPGKSLPGSQAHLDGNVANCRGHLRHDHFVEERVGGIAREQKHRPPADRLRKTRPPDLVLPHRRLRFRELGGDGMSQTRGSK